MSILLAQLGDIHFMEENDPAVERALPIGKAIAAEVSSDITSVILAICGDATYSGNETQFKIARQFVESIETVIKSRCADVTIARVIVPGNHDCDFSGDQAARNDLLSSINETAKPADSITDIILSPLSEYFNFAKGLAGDKNAITKTHPFYHTVDIPDGKTKLRLHLFNTAWMSSKNEQHGSLKFPLAEITPPADQADCSFAILHHPTHWFSQPHAMRPLRDRMDKLASVVLVNHEHVSEATEQVRLFGQDGSAINTIYVSGGAIQESKQPDICIFNTLKIDVANKSLSLSRHEYKANDGHPYFKRTEDEEVGLSANELSVGPAGASLQVD